MLLQFKGGCREVGRSALLVNEEILIDYGLKPGDSFQYPLNGLHPRSVIISHGHLDHCGAVPSLIDIYPDIFMTPPTLSFSNLLARDTIKIAESMGYYPPFDREDLRIFMNSVQKVDFDVEFSASGYTSAFYNAGHIPGSASVYLNSPDNESLFYTGDINTHDTRLVTGADQFPDADTLIIESTYYGEDHPSRKDTESAFIESVQETLDIGGNVIIPAFAIGRTQEILMMLDAHNINAYVDGMGIDAYKLIMKHQEYVKNPVHLKRAFKNASVVKPNKRARITENPSVIVTTSGMLSGGPVMYYLDKLCRDPKTKIMLTGYQAEGTNGRMALDNGSIMNNGAHQHLKNIIEYYDFSAHCGDKQLKEIVKDFCDRGTETIFTMHGEQSEQFSQWINQEIGVDTYAPENGSSYRI
ncbi:RNA-metabolising metallo-beta-lactamase [Methanosalsum zhilinae DSM 4017]|uniref:RNA-metabolising metallo-beta-lactamase n=1 Tax=Methanosalsum zhilinae (strain DSM 4017 / NBRC 107636 / OCM 62 / WeN5) TaxID=679901 RepID=F7XK99_METZD|nr:MBL fold metallo-hydrolase [Methanosalsum zhilinae]AEH60566.1 RNA-metabolising metallo-beta-lactamase [Methanosalsum zhilinae DSM 4017]